MKVVVHLLVSAGLAAMALSTSGCAPAVVAAGAGTVAVGAAQERGLSSAASDTRIQGEINHFWLQHDIELYQRLDMTVSEGRVLLTGLATTPEMRVDAVRLAWQATGVQEVINEIEVSDGSSLADSARDTWITTQLRTRIALDSQIRSINYTIDTVNGVIYLMGVARDQAELDRVTGYARSLPHVRRVVSYVRV